MINSKYKKLFESIEAILFDMDGSLVDSMWIWKSIDIAYLNKYGYECPKDLQKNIEGLSVIETAYYFKNNFNIPASIEEMINDWNDMAYDNYINKVFLKPGALKLLDYCKNNNIKLGICSSNTRHLIHSVLKERKVYDYFDVIISGEDVVCGKPNPETYLKGASSLNVSPKNCLVFEDIINGIQAGNAANMHTIAVEDEYSQYQKEEKISLAEYYIKDFNDLWE